MPLLWRALLEALRRPTLADTALELALFSAPLWLAALVGLLLGWAWRPRWAAPPGRDASAASPPPDTLMDREVASVAAVDETDLRRLWRLVEERDGGLEWIEMMDRCLPSMRYRAWRREPKQDGPPEYRSSTIFEEATPETVRDFFGDDDFRTKNGWDNMLLSHDILEECQTTGTLVVHWIRKFPFFCSDREYIIGRRIWQSGRKYYCVTKGVPRPSFPRQNKPRRVDLYYSSWCIRPVESRMGDGHLTACEVLLFHHEDMGIPYEIAKLGIRQGMWGCVKRIEPGLRDYQAARESREPVSHYATLASINTKFSEEDMMREDQALTLEEGVAEKPKHWTRSIPKIVVVGGAVALACTLDRGLVTKAVVFGVARKLVNLGRRY